MSGLEELAGLENALPVLAKLIPDVVVDVEALAHTLRVRRATLEDVQRIAAIEDRMFYNGGGHARFLALQVTNATEAVDCAEQMVLVVEDEHGLVVAYAIWERWGAAGDYWKGQKTIHPLELDHKRKAFPATLPLATPVIPLVPHVDPDMDAQWRAHTYACHSTITANFGGAYTECYYLHRLVSVSPVPGAGTMLVQWGVDRAKGEGVVWGCESTAGAFGFYRRFGARGVQGGEIGGWVVRSVLAPDVPATIVDVADEAAPTAEGEAEG